MKKPAPLFYVGLFTAAYLLAATAFAYRDLNAEFLLYIVVVVILGAWVVSLHYHFYFPTTLLWALSLWGLMHMLGGLLPIPESWPHTGKGVLYSWWLIPGLLKYDNIVHAYGFAIVTWGAWRCLLPRLQKTLPTVGVLIICVFTAMGAGALNEIIEFTAVLLIPDTNVGGYENTMWDLVCNSIGACAAAFWLWLFYQEPPRRVVTKRAKA